MKIYVATSWKNKLQPAVIAALRSLGHIVYDFRKPVPAPQEGHKGFSWSEISPDWDSVDVKKRWNHQQYVIALDHPASERGFGFDMNALKDCDLCVLVLPCGKSAHLELGYAVGAGKKTCILLEADCENITGNPEYKGVTWMASDPELMYKMVDRICLDFDSMLDFVEETQMQSAAVK